MSLRSIARLAFLLIAVLAMGAFGLAQNPADAKEKSDKAAPKESTAGAKAPSGGTQDAYVIGTDDVLAVHVWKEPDLTATVSVRPDGKITLPVIGDVTAGGRTPRQLQEDVQQRLKAYLASPEVTVIVQQSKSVKFNIVGDGIARPGSYLLTPPLTVLDAIAVAGGLKEFAKKTKIYVLRVDASGKPTRFPFNYKEVTKGEKLAQNIELQPRDTVVVP